MKMPENMTCWPPFSRQGTRQWHPAFAWRGTFCGRYNGGAFTKTVIDATMCAIIAQFIRDLLDFAGLSSNLALYNERVYRLHRY